MNRAIGDRCGGSVGDQLIHEPARDEGGMLGLCEFLLFHEDIGVQPFQQLRAVGGDRLGLRKMQMRVDQARQNEMGPMIGNLDVIGGKAFHVTIGAAHHDLAGADEHGAILEITIGRRIVDTPRFLDKGQHATTDQQLFHWDFPPPLTTVSYQATSRRRSSSEIAVTLAGGMACERPACR
jgi:hypothetical protein